MELDRFMGRRFGQMEVNMKESGLTVKLVVRVGFGMLMVTNMKAHGRKIKPTGTEFICTQTGPSILVIGRMTCSMATAKKLGLTTRLSKEST